MWSSASTTKSTGTMLMRPPSRPMVGHPRRQDLPHALDELEEVVRPVDLVHLAGRRVAHHHRRAVHASTAPCTRARTIFSDSCLVMKYGWSQALGLVEHVLAEDALVQARGGDAS
jgi:hypothetical protein